MLHAQLFPRVFELIHTALHFFQIGVYLRSILIIDVDNLNQTFFEHQALLLRLNARVIQTTALLDGSLPSTITINGDSHIAVAGHRIRGVFGMTALRA